SACHSFPYITMACWWLAVCLLSGIAAGEQLVGGLQVDSPDDPQVTQAARIAVNLYNRQSDDMYMYSTFTLLFPLRQVVAGVIYYLDVETVRCMKRQSPHMESCPQSDKTETFVCHFELLEVPWENSNQLLKVQCRPAETGVVSLPDAPVPFHPLAASGATW
uniref:Cystatin domain-containing protein n=1 Tax=Scleropages formosus TaxID=113540 RepID=A0A8C9R8H1_SCLFO